MMTAVVSPGIGSDAFGGTDAQAALYREHYALAVRLAYLLSGDADRAQDLAQDAFVRLFSRPRLLRDPNAFTAYLRRTVTNVCISSHRSATRERTRLERTALATPSDDTTEAAVDGAPVSDSALWSAVQRLPARQRAAVVLRYWLDLSERDVAEALRCRPGTVKSLVARALVTLRQEVSLDET